MTHLPSQSPAGQHADIFLWPKPKLHRALKTGFSSESVETVEAQLHEMFPDAFPVFCSSGRAALAIWIETCGLGRANTVEVFDYASHCVLDAISRRTVPVPKSFVGADRCLIYHQWGFEYQRPCKSGVIEDAVDSLCVPHHPIFPSGGDVEIWSLTKILGTLGGGVVWCRNEDTAMRVRKVRDQRTTSKIHVLCRLLAPKSHVMYLFWQGAEPEMGRPDRLLAGEISSSLPNWSALITDRKAKLELIQNLLPTWVTVGEYRLPSSVPLEVTDQLQELCRQFGFTAGVRHFTLFNGQNDENKKVLAIPIHQDVDTELFEKFCVKAKSVIQVK